MNNLLQLVVIHVRFRWIFRGAILRQAETEFYHDVMLSGNDLMMYIIWLGCPNNYYDSRVEWIFTLDPKPEADRSSIGCRCKRAVSLFWIFVEQIEDSRRFAHDHRPGPRTLCCVWRGPTFLSSTTRLDSTIIIIIGVQFNIYLTTSFDLHTNLLLLTIMRDVERFSLFSQTCFRNM